MNAVSSSEGVKILGVWFKSLMFILGKVYHKVTLGIDNCRWLPGNAVRGGIQPWRGPPGCASTELRAHVLPAPGKCCCAAKSGCKAAVAAVPSSAACIRRRSCYFLSTLNVSSIYLLELRCKGCHNFVVHWALWGFSKTKGKFCAECCPEWKVWVVEEMHSFQLGKYHCCIQASVLLYATSATP